MNFKKYFKNFILFLILFLSFSATSVYSSDMFIDDHIYSFYRKYSCYNKTYSDYNEVLKEFPDTYYYAIVKINKARKPILFVTDSVNNTDDNTKTAEYAILYSYKKSDKKVHLVTLQYSSGYPLSASKRFFYWGGDNQLGKYYITSNGTFVTERNDKKIEQNDEVTYEHFSYKGIFKVNTNKAKYFKRLNKELDRAKPISFKQIKE